MTLLIIGIIVIFVMVFGGYMLAGGKMGIILKALPFEMIMIAGACAPIPPTATTKPRVAARLYPGAVEATPMTRFAVVPALRVTREPTFHSSCAYRPRFGLVAATTVSPKVWLNPALL